MIETRYEHTNFPITFTSLGYVVCTAGHRQSGDLLTSFGNGLIHALEQHVIWNDALRLPLSSSHDHIVDHRLDGDDNFHICKFKMLGPRCETKTELWKKLYPDSVINSPVTAPLPSDHIVESDNIITTVRKLFEAFDVKLRTGIYDCFNVHYDMSSIDFLSHTFTPVTITTDAVQIVKYLPVRQVSELLGKLIFTKK